MKRNVRPLFYQDIEEEVAFLAEQAGGEIAARWADAVWQTMEELETTSHLGRERTDLPYPGVRTWRIRDFPRWLVFYGIREDTLVFYRVRHGAMNLITLDLNS